jgi:hypothetical protein
VRGRLPGGAYSPAVLRQGSTYLLLYMRDSIGPRGLYAAVSHDGFHWTSVESVPAVGAGEAPAFDSALAGHGSFLKTADRIMLWYTGYRSESGGVDGWKLRIGAAVLEASRAR